MGPGCPSPLTAPVDICPERGGSMPHRRPFDLVAFLGHAGVVSPRGLQFVDRAFEDALRGRPLLYDPEGLTRWLADPEDFAVGRSSWPFGEERLGTERSQSTLNSLGIRPGDHGDVASFHRRSCSKPRPTRQSSSPKARIGGIRYWPRSPKTKAHITSGPTTSTAKAPKSVILCEISRRRSMDSLRSREDPVVSNRSRDRRLQ